MKNIITLTMNPTIDKSAVAPRIVPDQKIRCEQVNYEPGGGGINVSRVIKRLGGQTTAVFPAGGYSGAFLQELVKKEGVNQQSVQVGGWTRENFIVVDASSSQQYRFGMPGQELTAAEIQACLDALMNIHPAPDYLVASGSLPPGVPEDFYARVGQMARQLGARFILDTSGPPLEMAVNAGVYLLKPNLGELAKMAGVDDIEMEMVDDFALKMIKKGNCEIMVVSMGPAGALLVSKELVEHIPAPTVRKRSTVGAGDSMVAGMVWSLAQGRSLSEMARYGVACGTAATMNPGTELCKKEDVENLYAWINKRKAN